MLYHREIKTKDNGNNSVYDIRVFYLCIHTYFFHQIKHKISKGYREYIKCILVF